MSSIKPVIQSFFVPVQQSGTNVSINLPVELRGLFGIEKGDILMFVANPNADTPLVVAEIQKPTRKGGRKKSQ
jgi:bifunctional DNA-binding transcriptional regulator/antitoxin component of YhaV-PrlF toxin-antitoxin module